MKAEHRKELETNVLADRLGRVVTNLKQGPQRGTAMYVVLGILVAAAVFIGVRWYRMSKNENSDAWLYFEAGEIKALEDSYPLSKPGVAWRFQRAWFTMWENGIKKLGADQKSALENLELARRVYEDLKIEVAGDPILEPEAMYCLAQIEETMAVTDRNRLATAAEMYDEVAKKHDKSAYGELAQKRAEILNDETKRAEVARLYQELDTAMFRFDPRKDVPPAP
jgi:hypothetical protein